MTLLFLRDTINLSPSVRQIKKYAEPGDRIMVSTTFQWISFAFVAMVLDILHVSCEYDYYYYDNYEEFDTYSFDYEAPEMTTMLETKTMSGEIQISRSYYHEASSERKSRRNAGSEVTTENGPIVTSGIWLKGTIEIESGVTTGYGNGLTKETESRVTFDIQSTETSLMLYTDMYKTGTISASITDPYNSLDVHFWETLTTENYAAAKTSGLILSDRSTFFKSFIRPTKTQIPYIDGYGTGDLQSESELVTDIVRTKGEYDFVTQSGFRNYDYETLSGFKDYDYGTKSRLRDYKYRTQSGFRDHDYLTQSGFGNYDYGTLSGFKDYDYGTQGGFGDYYYGQQSGFKDYDYGTQGGFGDYDYGTQGGFGGNDYWTRDNHQTNGYKTMDIFDADDDYIYETVRKFHSYDHETKTMRSSFYSLTHGLSVDYVTKSERLDEGDESDDGVEYAYESEPKLSGNAARPSIRLKTTAQIIPMVICLVNLYVLLNFDVI